MSELAGPIIDSAPPIDWKRPHPYTLIVEFVSSLRDLILPIAFIATRRGDSAEIFPMIAVLLPFGAALARYYSTRYALTSEALLHEYGVFKKNKQVLPRKNIQNLSTSAGLIARATGLVEVTASDASQGGDVKLRLLSVEDADALLTLLRSSRSVAVAGPPGFAAPQAPSFAAPSVDPFEAAPIHSTRMGDLVKFSGATSGGPLLGIALLVAAVVIYFAAPELREEVSMGTIVFALGPAAAVVFPALNPIFRLGGFRLWSDPDRLRIKTGLLTEIQMNARRDRLQLVQVDRHVFARMLGLEGIAFETADVEAGSVGVKYLAPAVALDSWPRFAADALGKVELNEDDLQRVSPLTERRSLVRWSIGGVPILGALVAAAMAAPSGNRSAVVAIGAGVLAFYAATARWHARRRARRLGWAVGDEQFLFRTGVIAEKLYLIRKEKVHYVRLNQSFFQRRLGLTSISIGTAGFGGLGRATLPDLENAVAEDLADRLSVASANTPLARTL
ncbi:MAG: PH domain-containing protein [Acidimicrobiales bacterium]|nr:PH domain-containing protein [Acidimicrobiales bacterium]